ncbi:MAG: hypothetical protein IH605_00575 [Burkholderiales bacterium]|nr:hypothetical protein [Burkholderiales bacterium]
MKNWTFAHSLALFLILVIMPFGAWGAVSAGRPLLAWLSILVLLTAFLLIAGHGVIGLWRGMLVDDRNVISLSRTQLALWTVIVLSAFLAAALWNLFLGIEGALAIGIPIELWALMGISTTSLVGTPLILSSKKKHEASAEDKTQTLQLIQAQGDDPAKIRTKGLVIANAEPAMACWSDMFTGDEVSNGAHLDLSKVQMFFFTIIVALGYAMALGRMFAGAGAGGFDAFPALDQSIVALLGISHGGYLVAKGVTNGRIAS